MRAATPARPWPTAAAFLLPLLAAAYPTTAQTPPAVVGPGRGWSVALGLPPLLASGYHFSAQKLLRPTSRHALVATPQWYRGNTTRLTSRLSPGPDDRVHGYGLEVQHRLYLAPAADAKKPNGIYLAYGAQYQRFRLRFQSYTWGEDLAANGLYYYDFRLRDQQTAIQRYGLNAVVGQQLFLPGTPVFFDMYLGLGYWIAQRSSTVTDPDYNWRYNKNSLDYGYSGSVLRLGLRVGAAW